MKKVNIEFTDEEAAKLKEMAKQEGRSRQKMLEIAIREKYGLKK